MQESRRFQPWIKSKIYRAQIPCPICLESRQKALVVASCGHVFHSPCIREMFLLSIQQGKCEFSCPIQDCGAAFEQRVIRRLLSTLEFQKAMRLLLQRTINFHKNNYDMRRCPQPDCPEVFRAPALSEEKFQCSLYCKLICLRCMKSDHGQMGCRQWKEKNDILSPVGMLFDMAEKQKYQLCKKCCNFVQKKEGCNHITCRCGFQFCYTCGEKWPRCACVRKREAMVDG